jgi:hypothetical protein
MVTMAKHKQPESKRWTFIGRTIGGYGYRCSMISVISSVDEVAPGNHQYHVSAVKWKSCTEKTNLSDDDLKMVAKDFGMEQAKEQNEGAIYARNLWLKV